MQAPLSILVIDDDADVRTYLALALRATNHPVIAAATLPADLQGVGLALVDLLLDEGQSGVPLVEALVEAGVRTVVMSGLHQGSPEVQAALNAGALRLLAKPFALAELRATVLEHLLD